MSAGPAMSETSVSAADGAPLHVAMDGPAGAAVTVVLAHGWTLDSRTWGPVTAALTAAGARVVRPDHRGHGRSAPVDPSTMTVEQLADDLAAVVDTVAPAGPLVLGGHSLGGMAIMALAQRHPEIVARTRGVALVASASGGLANHTLGLPPALAALVARGEARLHHRPAWATRRSVGAPLLIAPGLRWLLLGRRPSRLARRLTVEVVSQCRPLTVSGFRPALDAHERDAALAAFSDIPTVVLVGSRDRLTPVRQAARIVAALPSAQLTVFPDAGHMLPLERVAGVASRLGRLAAGPR